MRQVRLAAFFAFALASTPAVAQDTDETISLELNRIAVTSDGGCQVTFFGQNGLSQDFGEVTWRLAVFDADGVFLNLLALPLGALSEGKRRVVQFNLPSACDSMSEIIVNDVSQCKMAGSDADSDACLSQLTVSSRTDIAFGL